MITAEELTDYWRIHGFDSLTLTAGDEERVEGQWAFIWGCDEHGRETGDWAHDCLGRTIFENAAEVGRGTCGYPRNGTAVVWVRYKCQTCGAELIHITMVTEHEMAVALAG